MHQVYLGNASGILRECISFPVELPLRFPSGWNPRVCTKILVGVLKNTQNCARLHTQVLVPPVALSCPSLLIIDEISKYSINDDAECTLDK